MRVYVQHELWISKSIWCEGVCECVLQSSLYRSPFPFLFFLFSFPFFLFSLFYFSFFSFLFSFFRIFFFFFLLLLLVHNYVPRHSRTERCRSVMTLEARMTAFTFTNKSLLIGLLRCENCTRDVRTDDRKQQAACT